MKTAPILMLAGLAATAWAVSARTPVRQPKVPAGPPPQELVQVRQAGMDLGAATLGGMRGAMVRGMDPKTQGFAAASLAKWAIAMPVLFAPSTKAVPGSSAKPEIWSDTAGFAAKAESFAKAAAALSSAAEANDKTAFEAALASTGTACKGCHDSYKVPPPAARPG